MPKVSDYIAERLKEVYGVRHVFMVSGGGAMHLNDSFGQRLSFICNHNEQASGIAAEGYARYAQKLGVVNVTTGPGGLNALNGLFGCWTDSVPVLFISGQVKFSTTIESCREIPLRQLGDQEVDIISVVKPLTKYAATIRDIGMVKYHLDRAVYEATHERFGPVWLDVPMNIQGAMMNEDEQTPFVPPSPIAYDCRIPEVLEHLSRAKRPLIVAGHGIRLSGAIEEFRALLENFKSPVVTTFNGFDLLEEEHPLYAGRIGTVGQRAGNFALQNADCILFLGTRNNIRQISYNWENFAPQAFKIVVDIDDAELHKPTVRPDLPVLADVKEFLERLVPQMPPGDYRSWVNWCVVRREKYSAEKTPQYRHTDKINVYGFVRQLTHLMDENDVLVAGNGSACVCLFQAGVVKRGQRQFFNSGDASMGYDLPAAIGASLASGRRTVCLTGDGSIMMNLQELETIRYHNLPIKIFIINNDGYSSIRQTQNNFFAGRHCGDGPKNGVSLPDFVKVGLAFGIPCLRVDSPEEVEEAIQTTLDSDGPMICEVIVNSDYIFIPKLSSRIMEDGTMVSPSLEDMFPFLNRQELYSKFEEDIHNV